MFRELTRKKQQLSREECLSILRRETRGTLSVLGDDGYPYGMPMNHYFNDDDGKIYFHCGRGGHRDDALRTHDKVSFCVCEHGERAEGEWALRVRSVIVFGRIEVIDNMDRIIDITTRLSRKFTHDEDYIRQEIAQHGARTVLLCLTPEHICGKVVTEA